MEQEATAPDSPVIEESRTIGIDHEKPFVLVQFHGDGSADADFHVSGGISELMLFGISEMLKQFAYDQMAEKTLQRKMEEAAASRGGPQIIVPRDHLGAGGKKRSN